MPPQVIGASNATQVLLRCQMPLEVIGASNATQVLLGRQMPIDVIGASNATQGYQGVKCHLGIIGESKATRASKGQRQGSLGVKDWGVRDQGCQGSGGGSGVKIWASGFRLSNVPGIKGDESVFPMVQFAGDQKSFFGPHFEFPFGSPFGSHFGTPFELFSVCLFLF